MFSFLNGHCSFNEFKKYSVKRIEVVEFTKSQIYDYVETYLQLYYTDIYVSSNNAQLLCNT